MKETKFKQTEVGMIPSDWEETYLGNIGPVKMCKRVMKYQTSEKGDIPFYKIGTFGKSPDAYISKDLYHYLKNKYSFPQKGTVLISAAGTIGRTVVYDGKDAFFQDSNIVWLENDESVLTNQYLYYLYQVVEWKTENGGAVSRLYNDNFKITPIAIPSSKKEQQRIANALSDVDTLIANLEKLIAKKKNIKQGAMQQLLTGKKRLPGFAPAKPTYKQTELGMIPTDWESINLGSIADIRTGKRNGDESETFGKYPFFVRSQTVYRINSYSFDGEAILIPGEGGIGSIFHYINGKFDYHQRVYKISDFSVNFSAKYLFYFMKRYFGPYAMTLTVKATVDSLRLPTFENFVVWYPPSKAEQTAIANILSDMDTEISALETKLAKYRTLKTGMMQQLLTGKVRLV